MNKRSALAATLLLFAVTPLTVQAELIYPVLKISAPAPHQTIWADDGRLEIVVAIDPPLRKDHAFVYELDGERRAGPTKQSSVTVDKVFRGAHTVSATVVDGTGHGVQSSAPVTVFVKHHTIIN